MVASVVAMLAMTDIRSEFESIARSDLPETTAALRLAQIGERLQGRAAALVAAVGPEERAHQEQLIETDIAALTEEVANLRAARGSDAELVSEISATANSLKKSLSALAGVLATRDLIAARRTLAVGDVLALQDRFKQIIGPSVLAITDAVRRGPAVPADETFVRAVAAQEPLLEGERLVDAAISALLIAAEAPNERVLANTSESFLRVVDQWQDLLASVPAGLRRSLIMSVAELARHADDTAGIPALRSDELRAVATANQLTGENRRLADALSERVDRLVAAANQSVTAATRGVEATIIEHTLVLAVLSVAAIAAAALLSYFFVIRDLGAGMRGVTTAMSRLAHGDRSVPVPATDRPDEIGDLARAFIVFRENATRMDTLDHQLSEKSNLLVATFDNMNDGFTVFDDASRLVAWNPQYLSLYDMKPEQLESGMRLADIQRRLAAAGATFHTPLGAEIPAEDLATESGSEARTYEARLPGGRILELRTNPSPAGGFVTIHTDVTERKAIEAQLRQAQKMEVVGQLTGGLAHDFNNVLAVIQGNLHLLDEALADRPELRERAERALAAGDRAAMQIERLLAFSRRQKLNPETVAVNDLVAGMVDLLEYSAGANVRIETELGESLPPVLVDPGQLENAILNLVVNARDAMESAGAITISTCVRRAFGTPAVAEDHTTGERVDIAVRDNGPGMSPDVVDRAFEPFFTTKELGKGSGLGLSMIYGFVRQSGGDVRIDSEPGAGTSVVLSLPVADRVPAVEARRADGSRETEPIDACVLVVEDEPDVRDLVAAQLRNLGYRVIEASDAAAALQRLRKHPDIDLLYTDIRLGPGPNGYALARVARGMVPLLQILYTSAETTASLEAMADADPEAEVLQKPVAPETLAAAIERRVSMRPTSQTVSTSASNT